MLLLLPACLAGQAGSAPPVLTSIAVVRALSPAEAAKGLPVRLTGVVTYVNYGENDLFIQGDNAWIYVQQDKRYNLTPGERVVVEGKTAPSYNNQINSTSVRVIGEGPMPQPALLDYSEAVQRENDCRYATLVGIVRAASYQTTQGSSLYLLRTEVDGKIVDIVIPKFPGFSPEGLLDATVRATGALGGTFDSTNDRIVSLRLNVSSGSAVQVVRPGDAETAERYPTPLAALLNSNEILKDRHRVFTTGVVTLYDPGEMMVVQDGNTSLLVRTRQMDPLDIGQRVEVTGFLTTVDGVAGLDPGQFRVLPGEKPVTSHSVTFAEAMSGLYANRLVTIEGEVISQTRESHLDTIILRSGDQVFPAVYRKATGAPDPFPVYQRGAQIRATGVCLVHLRGFWGAVESFQIHLRSPQDIVIVKQASWFTLEHLFYLTSALLGTLLIALAWGLGMRRKVLLNEQLLRHRSEQEAARMATMARLEQQRSHILELMNSFQPLPIVLSAIQAYADGMWPESIGYCHVLLNRKLVLMTRSHLPEPMLAHLDNIDPTHSSEPCAEAVRSRGGVGPSPSRNAWSRPILSSRGEVLGTMTFEGRRGRPLELKPEAFEFGCNLAAVAIDNRRLYEDVLHRSEHDQLTGLANRALVDRRLEDALAQAHANQRVAAVLYLDLDDFKSVNDSYTHRVGDAYLVEVAQRFRACLRDCDTLGRVGGDEFIAVLTDLAKPEIARSVAERLVRVMDEPFDVEGYSIRRAVSVGLACYPTKNGSAINIMQIADHAMYAAKRAGGNRVSSVEDDMRPSSSTVSHQA
ncbi:MAG TPA: diguanylate cyclase [Acidobacteriaceae bacterium]|nr:diguanylate cyclase [Acidobacteriaceae bacterium]